MGTSNKDAEPIAQEFGEEYARTRQTEQPQHEVTLSPFLIAKYEVTQAEWQKVMGTSEASLRGLRSGLDMVLMGNNLKDQSLHAETFAQMMLRALDTDVVLISRTKQALERVRERKSRFARRKS